MKLAFILFRYFPFGGLQRDFLRIAETCLRRGHKVHVFTMSWEAPAHPDLPVTLIPVRGKQNHSRIRSFIRALPAALSPHGFDRIVGFNKMPGLDLYYAADTCFQAKARSQHGGWYRLLPRYRALMRCEQAVFAKDSKTHILLLSVQQQPEFTQYYHTGAERFCLLPPGIGRDRLAKDLSRFPQDRAQKKILFVGSGFRTKGLDRAIKALAALPPPLRHSTRLSVAGSDSPSAFLRLARQLGVASQVEFLGGRDDIPDFLQTADLLIHPARNENTGTVLLEALASGLPVLTTAVCGYAHYVTEADAGIVLAPPFQQEALNAALKDMLSSPHPMERRARALAFAQQADIYSLPECAADLIESLAK